MTSGAESMERIVPTALEVGDATGDETLRLHLERYRWAAAQLPAGRTLDLACGVGYGSVILAEEGRSSIIAGDISRDALRIARQHYRHPQVSHILGDGAAWCRDETFTGIVSLETIEHVERPTEFFGHLTRLLRRGGVLVASVPVTPSVDANPHHRTDFTARAFRALGARQGLEQIAEMRQVQPYAPIRILARTERRTADLRRGLLGYYLRHPGSAVRRAISTLRYGFTNHYLTVAWRRIA
jgi:2-polyprenyl-3-methyl-5-hydroxy-6-metoxy-1,4-benzoquinol methylase